MVGISNWSKAQVYKAQEAQSTAMAMASLNEAMLVVSATVNTQKLEILPMLEETYGTRNLQEIINSKVVENDED